MNEYDICSRCPLFECNDKDPNCLLRQTAPERIEGATRKEYFADYYKANRNRKLAAAIERQKANPRDASYYREYRQRVRQRT
jgi:hypothetical protein